MKTVRFKRTISIFLALAFILSAFSVLPGYIPAAADDSNSDAVEVSLPDISGTNGFVHYTMDDAAGTTVMATATDGTPRDTISLKGTFVPDGGIIGGALKFNGTSDYVQVNNNEIGSTGFLHGAYSAETLTLWIKPDSLSGKQMIFKQGGDLGGMALRINNGYLEAAVATGSPNQFEKIALDESYIGKWTHITLCFNNGTAKLYLDGVETRSITTSQKSIPAARKGASIARNMFEPNSFGETAVDDQWYSGMIDDFRIYSVAVTPKVNIKHIEDCGYQQVTFGSNEAVLTLPEKVTAVFSSNLSEELNVTEWTAVNEFDGNTAGVYEYIAKIACPDYVSNDNYIEPVFYVVVDSEAGGVDAQSEIAAYKAKQALGFFAADNSVTADSLEDEVNITLEGSGFEAKIQGGLNVTAATVDSDGQVTGTLIISDGTHYREVAVSLVILKLNEVEGATYFQCADKKNYYIYIDGGSAKVNCSVAAESREFTVVPGLSGEGVSFKFAESGLYLIAEGDSLKVAKVKSDSAKQSATFIEENPLGAEPGWANVYKGGFYSYRLAGSDKYITHTAENTVGLKAISDTSTADEKLTATFKRSGVQTALPVEDMRGAVYYPSYSYNAYQTFKYYDHDIINRDMQYAENLGINAFRVWVSYEYWLEDPVHFKAAYDDLLDLAEKHNIKLLTSLFDGCGEAFSDATRGRYYANSYCITSPAAEIFNTPSRYNEPLEFVTWFMSNYRNDTRHFAIEIFNEPWGDNRSALAIYLCEEAVKLQGCVALSGGTAPSDAFSIPKTISIGMDIIQYHDNFPSSASAFKSNAVSKIALGKKANVPTFCTEVQWVAGPDEFPEYNTLAPTCEEIMAEYEWAPFYWTLMVHPGYLKEIRNKVNMTNGFIQEDGNPWSVDFIREISPETDVTKMTDNHKSAFTQYYYSHTYSDDFLDNAGKKWSTDIGEWTAENGYFLSKSACVIKADLTEFSDFGVKFTVAVSESTTAGIVVRANNGEGYFAGISDGNLCIGKAVSTHTPLLAKAAIEAKDFYELELYAYGDTLTLVCGDTVVTATDSTYTSGQLGLLSSSAGAVIDNISASVNYKYSPEQPKLLGDMDADGKVTVSDVVLLRKVIMQGTPSDAEIKSGDFDNDSKLTVSDVVALRALIMKG